MIISQPKTSFLGVVFDVDHDSEGPRASKAHLDTVLTKPVIPCGPPLYFILYICVCLDSRVRLYTIYQSVLLLIFKQGGGAGSAGDTPAAVTAPHIERRRRTKLRPGQPCQNNHIMHRRTCGGRYHKPITSLSQVVGEGGEQRRHFEQVGHRRLPVDVAMP